jgi:hypothetical protein
MSRTQQKLQAMSAQELLIQEKKRKIEEKMRLDNAKKSHIDTSNPPNLNHSFDHQPIRNNMFKNDGSFLEQFQKSQGQLSNHYNDNQQSSSYGIEHPSTNSSQSFGPPWFPSASQHPPSFPMPPLPFNPTQFPPPPFNTQSAFFPPPSSLTTTNNSSGFIPSPFLPPPPTSFPLPPPDLLSKMLQTPPPPLPVPAPVNNSPPRTTTNPNINNEDLYDPLKAEDDDDEEETELKTSPIIKPINRLFNIKKEYTIKIEPNQSTSSSSNSNRKYRSNLIHPFQQISLSRIFFFHFLIFPIFDKNR